MSYRADVDAARARTGALAQELADLEARLGERAGLEARMKKVRAELAAAQAQVDHARKKGTLPLLDRVMIKTPCKQPWADMAGDEHKRFCGQCQKHVYDLSSLTAAEAEELLQTVKNPCLRLFRRPDGTVLTSDCPEGARRRARGRLLMAGAAVAAAATVAGAAVAMLGGETKAERPEVGTTGLVEYSGGSGFAPEAVQGGASMPAQSVDLSKVGVEIVGEVAPLPPPPKHKHHKRARQH